MRKESRLKQQRVPAPKNRREPLPVEISVKHHLPVSAEGTATDLTVAEIEARSALALEYSTSQAKNTKQPIESDHSESRPRKGSKRAIERRLEAVDLNIGKSFVRVPNAVADRLARQLSPAEEKIFDQIWRLTVGYNREIWRGKISDLMLRTGYSSRATVTKAIAGLSALNLITVEGRDTNPRGRIYRISDRAQLLDYQRESRLLDQSIKKSSTTQVKSGRVVELEQASNSRDLYDIAVTYSNGKKTSRAFKDRIEKRNDDSVPSSSWGDDEVFKQIRLTYQDLTGNHWGVNDEAVLSEIAHIPLPFIILGICYSITRAAEHRVGSLKYCIPSIREHYEIMKNFDHKDLVEIACRHLVRVKEAQRSGRWTSA